MAHTFAAAEVLTAANLGARINWSDWTAVSFENSWVNYGGADQAAQYRKIGDIVYLRGAIKSGSLNATAFTLPSGFRPPATIRLASSDSAIIIVTSAGPVGIYTADNTIVGINVQFSVTA